MKILVKNIGRKVTADSLAAVFATYGSVVSSTILETGEVADEANAAMVIMADEREAAAAIAQLNGCFVAGRAWLVEPLSMVKPTSVKSSPVRFYDKVRDFLLSNDKTAIFI